MDAESPPKKRTFEDAFAGAPPLVVQYKPFILRQARKFSQRYWLKFSTVRDEAIQIAKHVEPKFDPTRGKAFPSFLEPWLWGGLTRYCKREFRFKNGIMSRRQKIALGLDVDRRENWEKEQERREKRKEAEANRRAVGWGGGSYRTWKAGIGADELAQLHKAAEAIRPDLNQKQSAMLDWVVGDLTGCERRTVAQAAADAGITLSYASKIVAGIACNIFINYW